jgi:TonB family protein
MKTLLCLALLLPAVACAQARFESIGVEVTVEPQLPAVLMMNGLRDGRVVLAIDVDAEGKLTDWLVLGASHRELIRPCVEALQKWDFRPARYAGLPVLAQLQLTIDLSQKGAVISRTAVDSVTDWLEKLGGRRHDYQVCPGGEIDRPPVALTTVAPRYPAEAAKKGVRGRVKVHFYIDEQGAVRMPAVPADTHPYLSWEAIKALREWKFEPPTRRGQPVLVAAAQEFNFGEGP